MKKHVHQLATILLLLVSASSLQGQIGTSGQTPGSPIPATPLSIKQAVSIALQNNNSYRAAQQGRDAAKTKISQALSNYLPQLNFDETITRGNNPVYVFGSLLTQRQFGPENFNIVSLNRPDALDNFQAKLSLQQVIYDAGKIRGYVGQARLGEEIARKDVERTKQELIFRVVKAYTLHLLARSGQQVAEDAVKTAAAAQTRADSMFQSGMIVESDKLAAQVFRSRMEEALLQARNQVALSMAALNFELGLPVDSPVEVSSDLTEARFDAPPETSLFQQALEQRPDYLQTLLMKDIAKKGVTVARSEFLPQAGFFGSWESDTQTLTQRGGNNWIVGAQVHINLFHGRGDQARLEEAKANLERSTSMSQYMSSAVKLQVKQASLDLETSRQRLDVTQSAIAQAEESLRITLNRYGAGLTTITDLLRAQTDLTQARTAHLQALFDHRIAKANLELASGTLNENSEVVNP
ncbi:MAG: TolC family protein [Acidobacteriia bacterium]|nr:TolC family protein [Terriglobia bacterium]